MGFRQTGEVSLTIKIVYYPIAIGLGVCFFIQMLVILVQFFQAFSGGSKEALFFGEHYGNEGTFEQNVSSEP